MIRLCIFETAHDFFLMTSLYNSGINFSAKYTYIYLGGIYDLIDVRLHACRVACDNMVSHSLLKHALCLTIVPKL